ncbi:hypothetical protein [Chryseobacterium wanjuense]
MMGNFKLPMLFVATVYFNLLNAQIGINTDAPQATLDVVGKTSSPSSFDGIIPPRITGDQLRTKTYTSAQTGAIVYVTAADSAPSGQTVNVKNVGYYFFDGTVWKGLNVGDVLNGTGTVIAINGVPQIAQEVSARLDGDFTVPINPTSPVSIGRMTQKLIDNYNSFSGTATDNSFTVKSDGTYLVTMNFSIQSGNSTTLDGNCYYGLSSITDGSWVAFNIDTISNLPTGSVRSLFYQVAVELSASKTYSFAIRQKHNEAGTPLALMRGVGAAGSNTFPMTFFSVKRLK